MRLIRVNHLERKGDLNQRNPGMFPTLKWCHDYSRGTTGRAWKQSGSERSFLHSRSAPVSPLCSCFSALLLFLRSVSVSPLCFCFSALFLFLRPVPVSPLCFCFSALFLFLRSAPVSPLCFCFSALFLFLRSALKWCHDYSRGTAFKVRTLDISKKRFSPARKSENHLAPHLKKTCNPQGITRFSFALNNTNVYYLSRLNSYR